MRGLAVVALGAILIWFGLSRGDTADAAGSQSGESQSGESRSGSVDSDSPSSSRSDVAFAPPPTSAESWRDESSDGAPGGDGVDDRGASGDEAPSGARIEPVERVGTPSGSTDELAGEQELGERASTAAENLESLAPAQAPSRPTAPESFEFTGGSGVRPEKLATLLFEAWMSSDPSDLETYLRVGEGADLPAAKGQLVAGFWEALVGRVDQAKQRLEAVRDDEAVTTAQVALLGAALDAPGERAVPRAASATAGRVEPLAYAMRMVLLHDEAKTLFEAREYQHSAQRYSDLIQMELAAPWDPHHGTLVEWGEALARVQANHRFSADGEWPHIEERVQKVDLGLTTVRQRVLERRPDLLLCVGLLREVNGLGKYIHPDQVLRIPTDQANVIVDLDARVLLYRHGDEVVRLWDVGVGKDGHETPLGNYTIGEKVEKPAHTTELLPYGHPDNPLGSRWLTLLKSGQKTSYGIHGTWDPEGVGGRVSLGCVRMRNEDVEELFEILPMGARVVIQP